MQPSLATKATGRLAFRTRGCFSIWSNKWASRTEGGGGEVEGDVGEARGGSIVTILARIRNRDSWIGNNSFSVFLLAAKPTGLVEADSSSFFLSKFKKRAQIGLNCPNKYGSI